MNSNTAPHIGLFGLLAMTALMIGGLHRLGTIPAFVVDWSDPLTWANHSSAEDTIAATLRYVGLGIGYWVLGGTVLYATVSRSGHGSRWVRLVTLPVVRTVVDRALAATLTLSILATPIGPAGAEEAARFEANPVYQTVDDGIPVPHVALTDSDPSPPTHSPDDSAPPISNDRPIPLVVSAPERDPAPATVASSTYRVEAGDNLWTISAAHVRAATASEPSPQSVDRYWRAVIDSNRATLRSGDPNLIFPGEMIDLPAIEETP